MVDVYRGVFLYGDSGNGKSSLVNAGLLPQAQELGFDPIRVRVQPRAGQELVIEQIAASDDGTELLPCVLAPDDDSPRVVLSIAEFESRVRSASRERQPLIVFDQFEEILTLFEDNDPARPALAQMIVGLLREALPVKVLFAFREDYLGRVKQLLEARPELVDQALRLGPPPADALDAIICGPFERHPGHFARELEPSLAGRLETALAERFGAGDVSLSEVQTVCLRLWRSPDPAALLAQKGVQGLLEDELGEALAAFAPPLRAAAITLLSQMVTSAGTRNVISAEDLHHRIRDEDGDIAPALLDEALERLERDSRLVRRERRRDIYLYEITSEFLVPWISARREEARLVQAERRRDLERARERRRARAIGAIAGAALLGCAIVAILAIWALSQRADAQRQRADARRQASDATSLALTSAATTVRRRLELALPLALEAYKESPRVEARSVALAALQDARASGASAIMHGHAGGVWDVALSSDGRMLVSGSRDETVRLWDVRTRKPKGGALEGHTEAVHEVAISRDGRTVASASFDRTVRLWDVRTGKPLGGALKSSGSVAELAFSLDGRTLASVGFDGTMRSWDVRTRKARGGVRIGDTGAAAVSADRSMLASARDKAVRLWDTRTRKPLGPPLRGHTHDIRAMAFSADGRRLATTAHDTVRLWDTRTHKSLGDAVHVGVVNAVAFSPDGRTLASADSDRTVRLWDTRTHKPLGEPLTGHASAVSAVAFDSDGRTLVSAGRDGTLRLWDLRALRSRSDRLNPLAFSPDGRAVVSAGAGGLRLLDVRTRKPLGPTLKLRAGDIQEATLNRDGRTLAVATYGGPLRLWDVRTGKPLGALPRAKREFDDRPNSFAFSSDGRTLATASYKRYRLWDAHTLKPLGGSLAGAPGVSDTLLFSRDGRTLAAAGSEVLRLWDVRTRRSLGEPIKVDDYLYDVAFSPDGRTLATGSIQGVRFWDAGTRKALGGVLNGHNGSEVSAVAFSADGRTLASGGGTTLRLWDVRTQKPLGRALKAHARSIYAVAFSADGRALASAGGDGTLRLSEGMLWRNHNELQREVCRIVGTGLSRAEWAQYAPGIPYRSSCP